MCGFTGYYGKKPILEVLKAMSDRISHRGPDADGFWFDEDAKVAFAHRRLAIVDLTPTGLQPMHSHSNRWVIIFNGEIYNVDSLKSHFKDKDWRGHSDTEVFLESIDLLGLEGALQIAKGMFAFALWDKLEKKIFLGRDRLGEKPLYYGFNNGIFFFGSDPISFTKHPDFKSSLNKNALREYFKLGYVPGPHCIYEGIFKLHPGHFLELDQDKRTYLKSYWQLPETSPNISSQTENDQISELDELLRNSIREQMISDVPLGAFLSGGIDSSTVVAIMQSISPKPIKTFTIGFKEKNFNEAEFAKKVANYLGTDHMEIYIDSHDASKLVSRMGTVYSEPFSDPSQIPTYLISELAKSKVTVCLSGDAGDELFCGYYRYIWAQKLWNIISMLPFRGRGLNWALDIFSHAEFLGSLIGVQGFSDKVIKAKRLLGSKSQMDLFDRLVSHWSQEELDQLLSSEGDSKVEEAGCGELFANKMMRADLRSYLPDDILVKVDRAAMSHGLETRVPLLDRDIVEFALRTPLNMKLKDGKSKWILKQVLYKYLPRDLFERPKMGFAVPIDQWLRGDLKSWAEGLIEKIKVQKILNYQLVNEKWEQHQSGKHNWQYQLWGILMFQNWLENNPVFLTSESNER